ncbi:MAG: TIGR01906 family membrane protein [Chloroflexota bacterium]
MTNSKEEAVRRIAATIVTVLCLPLFLTATVLRAEINEPRLYYWSISQPGVLETTVINQGELEQACRQLIAYFNTDAASPQMVVSKGGMRVPLFNERELVHLKDVRDLIQLDYRIEEVAGFLIAACLAILALLATRPARAIGIALIWGSSLTLALAVSLAVTSIAGFDQLFWQFHVISFSNLMWQLDPSRDHLIQMFPQPFWYASAMLAVGLVIACAAGVLTLGRWLIRST